MTIYLGADHGGFQIKEKLKAWLTKKGYNIVDCGALTLDPLDDYPDFAFAVAERLGKEDDRKLPWENRPKGILICRSSGGVVIAANKVKGVRAVSVTDEKSAIHAREHNDANVIGLSGDWMDEATTKKVVEAFITTECSVDPRHRRRIEKIIERETIND